MTHYFNNTLKHPSRTNYFTSGLYGLQIALAADFKTYQTNKVPSPEAYMVIGYIKKYIPVNNVLRSRAGGQQ